MEMKAGAYGFAKEFVYQGRNYSVHVIPFIVACDEDKYAFHLSEGEFLVHLDDGNRALSFSVFYNDQLEWDSNVSKIVMDDRDLVERIGFLIDDYFA